MTHAAVLRRHVRRDQSGVVLFVAIIVLVAMTLAGLAMMRQMGVGASIAGNVAFKETATSVADRGIEEARAWIAAHETALNNDDLPAGYHSSWSPNLDPSTFDWTNGSVQLVLPNEANNVVSVHIERLCATAGASPTAPAQICSDKAVGIGQNRGGGGYPSVIPPTPPRPYFRITTRVDGPRNTRSYTQVLMQ